MAWKASFVHAFQTRRNFICLVYWITQKLKNNLPSRNTNHRDKNCVVGGEEKNTHNFNQIGTAHATGGQFIFVRVQSAETGVDTHTRADMSRRKPSPNLAMVYGLRKFANEIDESHERHTFRRSDGIKGSRRKTEYFMCVFRMDVT